MATKPLEVDRYEGESAYGEELSTYTASLTSSAFNFPESHGRSYHAYKAGRYYLPNDAQENDRLDLHYDMIRRIMDGKLYLAPISNDIKRAVDLGTGTGLWAVNFADQHEATEVIGIDLSPIQPAFVPPNAKFLVDDFEADWGYEKDPFDFIHACLLVGAVKDWPRLFQQAYNCTKPGGYVEFQDWDVDLYSQDGSLTADSALKRWNMAVMGALDSAGSEPCPGKHLEKWMKDAGFVDVTVSRTPVPTGPWAKDKKTKELGVLNHIQTREALEAVSLGTLMNRKEDPYTYEQVKTFLEDVYKDFDNGNIHTIYDFYIVYGKKPE